MKKKKEKKKENNDEDYLDLARDFDDFPTMIRKINLEPRSKSFENLELEEQIKHAKWVIGEKLQIDKFREKRDLIDSQVNMLRDSIDFKKEILKTSMKESNQPKFKKNIEQLEKEIEILLLKVDDIIERREHAIFELEKRMEFYDYIIKRMSLMLARKKYEQNKRKKKEDKNKKEEES